MVCVHFECIDARVGVFRFGTSHNTIVRERFRYCVEALCGRDIKSFVHSRYSNFLNL